MDNFIFENRTKIIFGKGMESRVGMETSRWGSRVLVHFGTTSAKKSGLLDRVCESLEAAGVKYTLLGGVQANPRVDLVRQGIDLVRQEKLDFILAVGGGSVIDSAKAIAIGVPYTGDVWDFFDYRVQVDKAMDVGVVLTIPAAGSEASPSAVLSNPLGQLKRGLSSEHMRPAFAILNPELSYSLPAWQTACGATDILSHLMERYFSTTTGVDFTDRLLEATMGTIITHVPRALENPKDYNSRSQVMWAGCVAHNDLLGTGRSQAWACHQIEHEISAIYDIAHGAGLAVVFPAWMRHVYRKDIPRFVRFAREVWKLPPDLDDPVKTAAEGILSLEVWLKRVGMPIRLSELGIDGSRLEEMAAKASAGGQVGGFHALDRQGVVEVLKLAL